MRRTLLLGLLCLPLASCATNAVLELTLDFPPDPPVAPLTMPRYAIVQARPGNDFSATWAGSGIDGAPLSSAMRTTLPVSIVADEEMVQRGMLGVRVRYCSTRDCSAIADGSVPESQFVFERAFYREDHAVHDHGDVDPDRDEHDGDLDPEVLVAGCIGGTTTNYCHDDGGVHYCE